MAFEDYQDLPDLTGAGLRRTDYGPGFSGGSTADKRELTGIQNISLRANDVALPPQVAARYGLKPGQSFTLNGQPYRYADNPNPKVGNVFDVYHPGASQTASPGTVTDAPQSVPQQPFAQGSPGNVTDNPFQNFGGTPAQSSPGNVTDNPWQGWTPPVGGDPNELTLPYNQPVYPSGPETTFAPPNPPTSEGMTPTDAGFAPPPTSEGMFPTNPNQYQPSDLTNPPTSEAMTPTDPNQYQSSNIPTNESMVPTDPNQYFPSTPSNVPTNEAMTPTDAGFQQPAPPEPASYYPDGNGGYVPLDAQGNAIPTGTGVTPDVLPATGVSDPWASTSAGAVPAPQGPGDISVGGGERRFNWDYYGQMGLRRLMQGRDPSLGFAGLGNYGQRNFKGRPLAPNLPPSQWGGTGFGGDQGTPYGTGAVNPDLPGRAQK